MIGQLMTSRRFAPLFWCQFFSALNDNFLKNALVILVLFTVGGTHSASLVTLTGAVFIAPFFLLSGIGGQLADKHDKALLARRLKFAEIFAAGFAAMGFALQSVPLLMVALASFGVIAALFGPIKYGILPDHLELRELASGNALVEAATFLAILIGTIGGALAAAKASPPEIVVVIIMVLAIASWLAARFIPTTGSAAPALEIVANPWTSTIALLKGVIADNRLWSGLLVVSWFWLVGAVAIGILPTLIKERIGGTESIVSLALAVFAVGVACGSFLAARLSHVRPNLALVPIGGFVIGLAGLDLAWSISAMGPATALGLLAFAAEPGAVHMMIDFFLLAFGGGLFVVPAFAAVQAWAAPAARARVIAAGNVLSAAFVVISALLVGGMQAAGVGPAALFAGVAVATILVTIAIARVWRREGIRDLGHFIFRLLFRLEVRGLENVPPAGTRMVIAPNHVSLLDGPLLHSVLPVDAAFAVDTTIATVWWAKPFMAVIRAYRLDPTRPLATRDLVHIVERGEPLVIFPEGRVTVTGSLMKVYSGAAMVADKANAVIVPVRIEGAQRSPLSYLEPGQVKRVLFPKITITILPPRRLEVSAELKGKARRLVAAGALQDLMVEAMVTNAMLDQTLFQGVVNAYKLHDTGKPIVEDPLPTRLTYRKLILGAQVLSRKLEGFAHVGEPIGVLLPNSAGVAVTILALQTIGRVPAMLNFSAGAGSVLGAMQAANLRIVLTSRAFIEKANLQDLIAAISERAAIVYLDDIRQTIGIGDKIRGLLDGTRQRVLRRADDPAVILFTSGSEGTPKGVVLSHRNILANAAQAMARVDANGRDKVFNVLPVFHSFGLTGGLMMPLLAGIPVYLYPSPLHYRIIPELIYGSNATILFGTDTFLTGYGRSAHPYDFRALRLVLAGAEAVKERTRALYMSRFGVRILEGYGVTETAPVLAMNTPMANRAGSVGRLSPLMEARLEPVPGIERGGRLFVRGPNVMLGYLHADRPGLLQPLADGWHDTGDIVEIDAEGFITILGRAKRFAKIAGEMVSLGAVEAMASALWPQAQSVAVSLPDARKGERIILLTTEKAATRETLQQHIRADGASELATPAEILVVNELPVLGTGKADYVAATALAKELVGEERRVA